MCVDDWEFIGLLARGRWALAPIMDPSVAKGLGYKTMEFLADRATPTRLGSFYQVWVPEIDREKNLLKQETSFNKKCYCTMIHNHIAQRLGREKLPLKEEDEAKGLAFAKESETTVSETVEKEVLKLKSEGFFNILKPDYWHKLSNNERENFYLEYIYYFYQDILI